MNPNCDYGGYFVDSTYISVFMIPFYFLSAFIVKYKIGEDVDLAEHFDNAEVTLNVSLSTSHTGWYRVKYYLMFIRIILMFNSGDVTSLNLNIYCLSLLHVRRRNCVQRGFRKRI